MKQKKLLAWHFLRDDGCLRYGSKELVVIGKRYKAEGDLVMCQNGMHASIEPLDALQYAPGSLVCRVELSGQILTDTDKVCARYRKVLAMADATRTLRLFACDVAEEALALASVTDERSHKAIAVKRAWVDGKATDAELAAARDAAKAAAGAAARDAAKAAAWDAAGAAAKAAARAAARDAARAAARDAAKAAAWDAAGAAAKAAARAAAWAAAWDAARDAARAAQNKRLSAMLTKLLKAKP